VLEVAKIAIGGDEATDVLEGQRRFAIFVRLKDNPSTQVLGYYRIVRYADVSVTTFMNNPV